MGARYAIDQLRVNVLLAAQILRVCAHGAEPTQLASASSASGASLASIAVSASGSEASTAGAASTGSVASASLEASSSVLASSVLASAAPESRALASETDASDTTNMHVAAHEPRSTSGAEGELLQQTSAEEQSSLI
jgi:hypothetical protein